MKAKDNEVVKFVKEIKNAGVKVFINKKWQIKNNLFVKKGNVYISRDNELRLEIIWLHYNIYIADYG